VGFAKKISESIENSYFFEVFGQFFNYSLQKMPSLRYFTTKNTNFLGIWKIGSPYFYIGFVSKTDWFGTLTNSYFVKKLKNNILAFWKVNLLKKILL